MGVIRIRILGVEVLMGCCGDDTVHPGLSVFTSGSCEGSSGELFGIESIRNFLRGVVSDGESTFDGF